MIDVLSVLVVTDKLKVSCANGKYEVRVTNYEVVF